MKHKENNQTPAVINFDYEGNPISFTMDRVVMANATEMAKPFGKQPNEWLRLPSTEEFLKVLEAIRFSDSLTNEPTGKSHRSELIKTVNGVGTWMHEDVALEFSRWLSLRFAIWCNDRIKELITTGSAKLTEPKKEIEGVELGNCIRFEFPTKTLNKKLHLHCRELGMKPQSFIVEAIEDKMDNRQYRLFNEVEYLKKQIQSKEVEITGLKLKLDGYYSKVDALKETNDFLKDFLYAYQNDFRRANKMYQYSESESEPNDEDYEDYEG